MRFFYNIIFITTLIFFNTSFTKAQVTGLDGWNIFIDPGHSQSENMGIYNYPEAHKVLRVGLNLRQLLLETTDIDTVYMIRTNDQQSIDLSQRTDYANTVGAAWYHSIHSDASSTPSTNSTLLMYGGWRQNGQTVEKIPHGGKVMSDIMVDILTRGYRTNTRGNYADRTFYQGFPDNHTNQFPYLHVNRESNMASELSEAGFHTNPTQNQRNMNDKWKRLEAYTFYWSILEYHGIERPFVGIATGIISNDESGQPINGAVISLNGQVDTTDTYESLFHLYSTNPNQLHNGFYFFENLPAGIYPINVEAEGFYPYSGEITIEDTFFTFKDIQLVSTVPPKVLSTSPADNDSIYVGKEDIVFNFSRSMNTASVESSLVITPPAYLNFSWENSDKRLTISSDSLEYSTNYEIKIFPSAMDNFNNSLDGNGDGISGDTLFYTFKTMRFDQTAPEVTDFYPSNVTNVELLPIIRINFNETINTSDIYSLLKLKKVSDQSQINGNIRHNIINGKSVLHFYFTKKLSHNEEYQFTILAGIKDDIGNEIATDSTFSFTTGNIDYDITEIDNFESDLLTNWWQPRTSGSNAGTIPEETEMLESTLITNLITSSTKSMRLNYGWDLASTSWLLREFLSTGAPRNVFFDNTYIMQVYIFGDGSNSEFRFAVDDKAPVEAAPNHEVSPWYTIDWTGWKLVSWDMTNDGTGFWIGDGTLDGTLRFDSFQLTYNGGSQKGTIYLDDFRLVKKVVVGIEDEVITTAPKKYDLLQNYPNPFNPVTQIRFEIPESGQVKLEVYNLLGQKVITLLNEEMSSGYHSIDFNAENLSSGIYVYTLSVNNFVTSKKMILLK